MNPVRFPEVNRILGKPETMTDDECQSLPVHTDGKICVSCWELTDEELADLVKTRRLWLLVYSGHTQPPVLPMTCSGGMP